MSVWRLSLFHHLVVCSLE